MTTTTTDNPVERLQAAIWERVSSNQRVPQSWYERLEELKKAAPELVQQPALPPSILAISTEVAGLADRIAKGEAWLRSQPGHVKRLDTLTSEDGKRISQPEAEERWEALSPTGATVRALFGALNRAHAIGSSILAGDALIRRVEAAWTGDTDAAPDDDESAAMVTQMAGLFDRWESARREVMTPA